MKAIGCTVVLSLAALRFASAQTATDSILKLREAAFREYQLGTFEGLQRSRTLWAQALALLQREGDRAGEWTALAFLGQIDLRTSHPDSALDSFRRALPIARGLGDRGAEASLLNFLGMAYTGLGQLDSALGYHQQGLAILRTLGDRQGQVGTLANIASVLERQGRPDSALGYHHQAVGLLRELGDRLGEASALDVIGKLLSNTGRPDSALVYEFRSLALSREVGSRIGEGRALNDIGDAYHIMARPDSALAYLRLALPIEREAGDRFGEAGTLQNIGVQHQEVGRADSALAYYFQSLGLAREVGYGFAEAMALQNIGELQLELGRLDSALVYYHQTLAIVRGAGDRRTEGTTLTLIGQVQTNLIHPDSALSYYQQALAIARQVGNREGAEQALGSIAFVLGGLKRYDSALVYQREAMALARSVGNRRDEAGSLWAIGLVHSALGRQDSARAYYRQALAIDRDLKHENEGMMLEFIGWTYYFARQLPEAVAYFDSSAASIAARTRHSGGEANRVSFAELQLRLYGGWTFAWLAREPELGGSRSALAALAATERGRAQALLQLMRRSSAETGPGADLVAEGSRLLEPVAASGSILLSYLVTSDTLVRWFARPGQPLTVERRAIRGDTLAQWIRELREGLGVSEAARERIALRGGGAPEADAAAMRGVAVTNGPSRDAFARASRRLAEALLPSGLGGAGGPAGELVVIPQGLLGLVPFAALPVDSAGTPLGARFALRYAPSLAVLNEAEARPGLAAGATRSAALGRALVVGNPEMPAASGLGESFVLTRLPGAEAEARQVAAALGSPALTGAQASEAEVRRRLAEAPVVHLATHGYAYASEARARQSFIALAPGAGQDGFLTVGEVLDDPALTLRADLLVLSACQTGLGDFRSAEGTVGLQRAFLAKGARSVLVSLWSVSDEATALLMKGFYTHWLRDPDHPDKAEALRRAEEEVRKTPGFGEPRYWAAFQLVGAR